VPVVAFCPCPPVLLPELAVGAAAELDSLRAACDDAVRAVTAAAVATAGPVTVVGPGPVSAIHPAGARWSFHGFGADVDGGGPGGPLLALAASVGGWLLDRAGWAGGRAYVEVGGDAADGVPPDVRRRLHDAPALLVMGDGAACHSERAPLSYEPGAAPFDDAVAAALDGGDPAALVALDADEGRRLGAAGVPAWRAVAVALDGRRPREARLLAREAPYGVGYLVAVWT
jgi:hypothetical protein